LSDSISKNDKARVDALNIIYESHFDEFSKNRSVMRRFIVKLVNAHYIIGDKCGAIDILKKNRVFLSGFNYGILKAMSLIPRGALNFANHLRKKISG
jgi:hypothetical protein